MDALRDLVEGSGLLVVVLTLVLLLGRWAAGAL